MYDSPYKAKPLTFHCSALALCLGLLASQNAGAQEVAREASPQAKRQAGQEAPQQAEQPTTQPSTEVVPGTMTRPPELLQFVEAQVAHSSGQSPQRTERQAVQLQLTVQADGTVTDVEVVQTASPALDAAAFQAVSQFVFRSAEIDNQPGAVRIQYEYVFEPTVRVAPPKAAPTTVVETPESEQNTGFQPVDADADDLVASGRRSTTVVVTRVLTMRQIESVPGSNGDALKAVQNLPGVARTTGDEVVMRGVNGGQVLVNGHPITTAFHFGGLRSTVANGMIESLNVTPGNYAARFGGTNAGIVDIQTRRPKTDAVHGYGQIDLFDASVFLEGPAGENGAFAIGGRRSYIDGVLDLVLTDELKETFQAAPRYYDLQGSYDWRKGRHRLRLNALGSSDRMVLMLTDLDEQDPAVRGELKFSTRWATTQALWDYQVSKDTQWSVGLSYLWADFEQSLGNDLRLLFEQNRVTFRSDLTHDLTPWLSLRTGVNAQAEAVQYDVTAPPPPSEGQPDPNLSLQGRLHAEGVARTYTPAAYAAADLRLGPLQIVPAVRLEHFSSVNEFSGRTLVQPRLTARLALGDATTLKAGAGMYSSPPAIDQSNSEFGNTEIEPSQSRHYSAGLEQRLGDSLSLDATGFYQDLYNQISALEDPRVRYDNHGAGRVYGTEVLLKYDSDERFYGWLAYTASRSTRRASGRSKFRIYDFDQTHNVNIVGQYRLSSAWEIGGRFRLISGNPTTPVVGSTFDSDADTYAPIYGSLNSSRLGMFHQLDVRVDKHWIYDNWRLTTYLDVQNIYNRQNPEAVSYNYDFSQSKAAAGLPLIPSFGIKGEF